MLAVTDYHHPCPGGFLLADNGNNKVTLYSYTGDKVRTVLTKEDGLDGPRSLLLKPPFLWVGQNQYTVPTEE